MQVNNKTFCKAITAALKFANPDYNTDLRGYIWVWQESAFEGEETGKLFIASTNGYVLYTTTMKGFQDADDKVWRLTKEQAELYLFTHKKLTGSINPSIWMDEADDIVNAKAFPQFKSLPDFLVELNNDVKVANHIEFAPSYKYLFPIKAMKTIASILAKDTNTVQYELLLRGEPINELPFTMYRFTKEDIDMTERIIMMNCYAEE